MNQSKSRMQVMVIEDCGFIPALLGVGLSHGLTSHVDHLKFVDDDDLFYRVQGVASKLANKDGGHNKFLEAITVWLDIDAPRYWWQEFDTYRVGMTKQSESTIHTITRRLLTQEDFNRDISQVALDHLNDLIENWRASVEKKDFWFAKIKEHLPEGFLQRRVVCTNYKTLRNIFFQRQNHKLPEWRTFISNVLNGVMEPSLITATKGKK